MNVPLGVFLLTITVGGLAYAGWLALHSATWRKPLRTLTVVLAVGAYGWLVYGELKSSIQLHVYETGVSPWLLNNSFLGAYAISSVTNDGEDTIVDYKIDLIIDGKEYKGLTTILETPLTLTDSRGRCNGVLDRSDFLPRKTGSTPLRKNDRATGWILATFPTAQSGLIDKNPVVRVTAIDGKGRAVTARANGAAAKEAMGAHFYSGMDEPVAKPEGCTQ